MCNCDCDCKITGELEMARSQLQRSAPEKDQGET